MGDINQPLLPLRSDVRGGGHPVCRIDKEEYQEFAVARLMWIGELEGSDLVLVEVGDATQRSVLVITSPISCTLIHPWRNIT